MGYVIIPTASYDVAAVRRDFPALAEGLAFFDGPGGTQLPQPVVDAVATTLGTAISNRGGPFVSSERAEALVAGARQAAADLVGADPRGVIIGQSMTAVTYVLAGALAKTWQPGDDVVVTRLDHDGNVRPWVQAAERVGAAVRWADIDPDTCELPVAQYDDLLGPRTRLVAVTAGSNAVGTRPDVRAIADRAHAVGALVHVDGVHLTPHAPVDVTELGADFYAMSAYKFCGPHLGATAAAPELLESLRPDKLLASTDAVPARFEHGTPAFELQAGMAAAVDYLAELCGNSVRTTARRERLLHSMKLIEEYEDGLFGRLRDGLLAIDGVVSYGSATSRTPTLAFRLNGHSPREVTEALGKQGICAWDGHYYAIELVRRLGLLAAGGMVRVGIAPYTSVDDVDRLVAAVADVSAG